MQHKKSSNNTQIIYLIQSSVNELKRHSALIERNDVDVILLSYDKPVENAIFYPNSTWEEGRNKLLQKAVKQNKDYLYYIFLDEDVKFIQGDYVDFERVLLKYMPAIAYPTFSKFIHRQLGIGLTRKLSWVPAIQAWPLGDGQFQAFHRDVVRDGLILPYCTDYELDTAFIAACITQTKFYNDYSLQFNHIMVDNVNLSYWSAEKKQQHKVNIKEWISRNLRSDFSLDKLRIPHFLPFVPTALFKLFTLNLQRLKMKLIRLCFEFGIFYKTITYKAQKSYRIDREIVKAQVKPESPLWKQFNEHSNRDT